MELAIWTALVVVALAVVLWSFLRPRRHEELEREERLPLADDDVPLSDDEEPKRSEG